MKRLINLCLAIVACFMLTSCYSSYIASTTDDWKQAHIGATYNQLVQAYGAPDRQQPDGDGGTILIYEQTQTQSRSVATKENINYFTGTYTPGVRTQTNSQTYYNQFFINSEGTCYRVNTNLNYNTYKRKYNPRLTTGFIIGTLVTTASLVAIIYGATAGYE